MIVEEGTKRFSKHGQISCWKVAALTQAMFGPWHQYRRGVEIMSHCYVSPKTSIAIVHVWECTFSKCYANIATEINSDDALAADQPETETCT